MRDISKKIKIIPTKLKLFRSWFTYYLLQEKNMTWQDLPLTTKYDNKFNVFNKTNLTKKD